jgi:MFS family permease
VRMVAPARAVSALAAALRNKNLRRAQIAWGAAIAAEWAHFVALGVFAYQAGGPSAVGLAGVIRLLPAAAVAPFAASLGDRFRRERFLAATTLLGSLALAGSAAAFFAGRREPLVFGFAALVGLSSTLVRPALLALLPSLARTPEELIAANGATSTLEGLGTLVGPLLAGILVSFADPGLVFAVGAGTLLAGSVLLTRVQVEGRPEALRDRGAERPLELLAAGLKAVARCAEPRLLVALICAQAFVRGCLNVLIVVAAFRVLHAGAGTVGYMTAAIGLGGLAGAIGATSLGGRRLAVPFGLALVFWGLPLMLIAPSPSLALALVLLGVVGAANSVEDVAAFTLLQRIVPDQILTRVFGVVWAVAMGAVALGSLGAPAIVSALGPRPAFAVVGAILPLLTLALYRRLLDIDRTVAAPRAELGLIHAVPMFAPLSVAAKERMAAHLVRVSVAAGECVIRAGEIGDRFYIVADGEFEITADNRTAAARAGDYFGEIALLRDLPRTATVTAIRPSELYALERQEFLAIIAGHSAASAAGDAVVETRLGATPGAP